MNCPHCNNEVHLGLMATSDNKPRTAQQVREKELVPAVCNHCAEIFLFSPIHMESVVPGGKALEALHKSPIGPTLRRMQAEYKKKAESHLLCPYCSFRFRELAVNSDTMPDLAPALCSSCLRASLFERGKLRKMTDEEMSEMRKSEAWQFILEMQAKIRMSRAARTN